MNKYDYEIDIDYIENQKDAIGFRILRGYFSNKKQKKHFNRICNEIRDRIIELKDCLLRQDMENYKDFAVYERWLMLKEQEKISLLKKAVKTNDFLNRPATSYVGKKKIKTEYRFTDWVKEINLNLLSNRETCKQTFYSRDSTNYEGKGICAKMHLDYYPFLFIADAMYLLGFTDRKKANYIHQVGGGYCSRMKFSETGLENFKDIETPSRFKELIDHDLVVMTDLIPRKITKGKNKGKTKDIVKVIPYTDTDRTRKDKKLIRKLIDLYNKVEVKVDAKNVHLGTTKFLYDILMHWKNSRVSNFAFKGRIVNIKEQISNEINIYNYEDILKKDKISISYNKEEIEINNMLQLLMGMIEDDRNYRKLHEQELIYDQVEKVPVENLQRLEIDEVKFIIDPEFPR